MQIEISDKTLTSLEGIIILNTFVNTHDEAIKLLLEVKREYQKMMILKIENAGRTINSE